MWLRDVRRSTFSRVRLLVACVSLVLGASNIAAQTIEQLEAAFDAPPADARPWVFWYWMHGAVSPEGITADLEAMRDAGLGGAYLMPIQGPATPPAYEPPATQLSPRFWRMIRHAAREADRLDLQLGMHLCDGFATAGGPWITPEFSMQKVVWSEATFSGGLQIDIELPQPETREGYYRDIATLALPCPVGHGVDSASQPPTVTTSAGDPGAGRLAKPDNQERYRSDKPCWIRYDFDEPFTARSVTISPDGSNYQCQRLRVEAKDSGGSWRVVSRLAAPRHGWQDEGRPVTHALPETTSRSYRFSWTPVGSEPGAEDLDSAKWASVLKVQSIVLSSGPNLHHYRGKAGEVWRQSPATTDAQAPTRVCVPIDSIIDLSKQVDKAGRLRWDAPEGEWLILRFGHTSTGKRNATAGGIGLECDKLSNRATQLQYDRWYGEARRQIADEIGAAAMRRTLTTLHLDSWECGAQNWTADFAEEYRHRNGKDLTKWLPTMAGIPIESAAASERFLRNVRATIADLLAERFYGSLRQIADEGGLRFSGECTAPTMPGDALRHFARLDAPMGEFWLESPTHDKPTDMLDAISGAHVYGKRVIQAEAFTQLRIGWDETPRSLKLLGDRNLALGANRLVFHVWTHNPWLDRKPGQTLGGVGLYFQRDQPWIRGARGWIDYLARCQAVLQAGEPVVDVAVEMRDDYPRRALTPDKLIELTPGLLGRDFVARERRRVANEGQPQREQPAGVRASARIPDPGDWLDPLRGYKYDSVPPEVIAEKEYRLVHRTGDPMWTESDLSSKGLARDFEPIDGVAWTHRKGDGWDAYFVSNQRNTPQRLDLSLRATAGAVEVWDPVSGVRREIDAIGDERTKLVLQLEPAQSQVIVLRDRSTAPLLGKASFLAEIRGPWRLTFAPAVGEAPLSRSLTVLGDLTVYEELQDFVGEARYETTFEIESPPKQGRISLQVGGAAALAEVIVNGVDCGVAWTAPWRVEVTDALQSGTNRMTIVTPSTWKNRLVAERSLPEADRTAWTSAPVRLANNDLTPFGLLGPIQLLIEQPARKQ
ncbi:glycosyl hydrolase [Botrimarina mediterranea]|uniref:Glycosyl hydrolases family 2, sugar binding domain n=1 Tax=Botrimarina mediterranea TaxID=2528022 RepID=A0A518K8E3_9BACT|nr:glycosyl hydrolase [Botrimarina mediterranea]QDV74064.1 Glycosyl hydrolases family 2, sugar binding domain [Botrimarina mediterranea]QDV78694.1 Glycosyl hydrolases family 2, sugar binding domain [Planctomycetes bacterium K2D]